MAYPDYIEVAHTSLLSDGLNNMLDAVDGAVASNPYAGAYSYDPSLDLDRMDAALAGLDAEIDAALVGLSWGDMVDTVEAKADAVLMDAADIDAAVGAFETKHEGTLARSRARLAAGMAAIGAETSSAFWIGLGLLEGAFDTSVAEYRSQVQRETNARRADFIAQGVSAVTNILVQRANLKAMTEQVTRQGAAARILASKEYLNEEIQLAERDATWSLEQLHGGSALLGAVAGVGMRKTPMPAWASGLSAFMSGVGAMAPLAQASGNVGTGALITMLGGIFSGAAGLTEGY
jgi:hypothetical protein